jgi:hypothetical protein
VDQHVRQLRLELLVLLLALLPQLLQVGNHLLLFASGVALIRVLVLAILGCLHRLLVGRSHLLVHGLVEVQVLVGQVFAIQAVLVRIVLLLLIVNVAVIIVLRAFVVVGVVFLFVEELLVLDGLGRHHCPVDHLSVFNLEVRLHSYDLSVVLVHLP